MLVRRLQGLLARRLQGRAAAAVVGKAAGRQRCGELLTVVLAAVQCGCFLVVTLWFVRRLLKVFDYPHFCILSIPFLSWVRVWVRGFVKNGPEKCESEYQKKGGQSLHCRENSFETTM